MFDQICFETAMKLHCKNTTTDFELKFVVPNFLEIVCGPNGRAVTSDTRGARFESSHRRNFLKSQYLSSAPLTVKLSSS